MYGLQEARKKFALRGLQSIQRVDQENLDFHGLRVLVPAKRLRPKPASKSKSLR